MNKIRYSLNNYSIDFYDGFDITTYAKVDEIIMNLIKQIDKENTNYKQALIDIREYIKSNPLLVTDEKDVYALDLLEYENKCNNGFITHILEIIDKFLGGSEIDGKN